MAGAIRNSCVARGTLSAVGYTSIFTVPTNNVLLAKDIRFYNSTAAANTVSAFLYTSGGTLNLTFWTNSIPANTPAAWSGWIALNAGDAVVLWVAAQPVQYWVSGALLPFNPTL